MNKYLKLFVFSAFLVSPRVAYSVQVEGVGEPKVAHVTTICAALMNPHLALAQILPQVSDDEAIRLLNANYSELLTWLTQKADATAEGSQAAPKGAFGPHKDQTPSMLLYGRNIVEVDRTVVGILALKWLLADDYEAFTKNQAPPVKISKDSFANLRNYVKGILKTPEDIDAMIVMVMTNDLGKVKRYHELTEKAVNRAIIDHDELLFVGFSDWPETSPSFHRLSKENRAKIIAGLKMGSGLNVGQFAQAENLPANLASVLSVKGDAQAFEFKFVELFLDVAGANGHMDSGGAKVMIEPVFQNFMLARTALQEIIAGKSVREGYDRMLTRKAEFLAEKGFNGSLSVSVPEQRALLRLLTLRRTASVEAANELIKAFHELPVNAQAILVSELNVDGTNDGFGVLPYYAPALFDNALRNLGAAGSYQAVSTVLLSLARTLQEGRILLTGRSGNGVLTVNVEALATYVKSEEYKANPNSLLNQEFGLAQHAGDDSQFFVKLSPLKLAEPSHFPRMNSLADLPGQTVIFVGIGGGSDVIQATLLAQLAVQSGKKVPAVFSIRTEKTGSQGVDGKMGEQRTYEGAKNWADGVFEIFPTTKGKGRDLEPLASEVFPTYVVFDPADASSSQTLDSRLRSALARFRPRSVDAIVLVDTGGDSLYSVAAAEDEGNASKTTPDQDLRVLKAFAQLGHSISIPVVSAVMAVGVDSPPNSEEVLRAGNANYFELAPGQTAAVLTQYKAWQMDGSSDSRYGKTSLAWQAALQGATGISVVPLPQRVVIDRKNPWNPYIRVPVRGVFLMDAKKHLEAIGGHI